MKKSILFPFATISLLLVGCGEPTVISNEVENTERTPVVLTEDDMFSGNKIMAFLANDEKNIREANELFLKGLNSFRNEKDLDSAYYYFQKSILTEPSAKAYFELGNLFMEQKDYQWADLAYGVAEQLDYEPFSKILYNKACIYALTEKKELAGQYLEYALQAGYNNLDHINTDEDLENIRDTWYFRDAITNGLKGMSDADNLFWLQFKKQFAVMDKPIKLAMQPTDAMLKDLKFISYDYEKYIAEMRDEEFSREVSKGFYYYAKPYENENFVALVYIVKDEFMGDYAPLTYRMATFTHEGKLIDKKKIAGRESLSDPIMSATLRKNMVIDVDLMDPVYEDDPNDVGYYENPMISSKKVGSMRFKINEVGNIVEETSNDISLNQ